MNEIALLQKGQFAVVGRGVRRVDGTPKVKGQALYSDDIKFPNMLVAKVLRSEIAHGKIKRLDLDAARALPGVITILTASDVPGHNRVGIILKDEPVLVDDKIRRVGDPLALVVAESEDVAKRAIKLIKVEYETYQGVFDPVAAMNAKGEPVHAGGNILAHRFMRKGDIEAAQAEADVIIHDIYLTHQVTHSPIEPESGVAIKDSHGITIWASTQNPHFDRKEVARVLGLPLNQVRIIQAVTGGGFGGKLDISVQAVLGLAALKTGRPVKLTYTREESFLVTSKRHPFIIDYLTAARRDGRITGIKVKIIADTGAYASYGPGVITRAVVHATGPYEVPNVFVEGILVYTNNPVAGAMRGFGTPQVAFACEQQMDRLAEAVGLDPIKIRLINALKTGSFTGTGQLLNHSVGISETLLAAARGFGWGGEGW